MKKVDIEHIVVRFSSYYLKTATYSQLTPWTGELFIIIEQE